MSPCLRRPPGSSNLTMRRESLASPSTATFPWPSTANSPAPTWSRAVPAQDIVSVGRWTSSHRLADKEMPVPGIAFAVRRFHREESVARNGEDRFASRSPRCCPPKNPYKSRRYAFRSCTGPTSSFIWIRYGSWVRSTITSAKLLDKSPSFLNPVVEAFTILLVSTFIFSPLNHHARRGGV